MHTFLSDGGEAEAEVIGCHFNAGAGMGLEVPIDIKFCGTFPYLWNLRKELKSITEIGSLSKIEAEW